MGKKRVLISYGVDVDAVAGWLGSYGGEDSTSDISRGTGTQSPGFPILVVLLTYMHAQGSSPAPSASSGC